MTGTIINPIWFYLMDVLDAVETVSGIVAILLGIIIIIVGIAYLNVADESDIFTPLELKLVKCVICVFIISILLVMFIPSKETIIEMMVAKYATYENASSAVDAVKNAADYIVDAVLKIKKG
ncbi:MAG: hypothetical protein PUE12_17790 [Oscillospiraceae bacterium]|nr:hypothetical protein [Oscillospiraceae bacterium]